MIKNVAVVDEFADTTHGEVGITCERNPLKNLETTHKFVFATKGYTHTAYETNKDHSRMHKSWDELHHG
jgi:hypothetical protein